MEPENCGGSRQGSYRGKLPVWQKFPVIRKKEGQRVSAAPPDISQESCPSFSRRDSLLSDHFPGEPLPVYCQLVVIDSGGCLSLAIEIHPLPEGPMRATAEAEAIQPLARAACQGRYGDHLDQHVVD